MALLNELSLLVVLLRAEGKIKPPDLLSFASAAGNAAAAGNNWYMLNELFFGGGAEGKKKAPDLSSFASAAAAAVFLDGTSYDRYCLAS